MFYNIEDFNWIKSLPTAANNEPLKWLNCDKDDINNNKSLLPLTNRSDNQTSIIISDPSDPPEYLVYDKHNPFANDDINKYKVCNNIYKIDTSNLDISKDNDKKPPIKPIIKNYFSLINLNSSLTTFHNNYLSLNSHEENKVDEHINLELYNVYRQKVIKALHKRKFFTLYVNCPAIRQALVQRGWIEKCVQVTKDIQQIQNLPITQLLEYASDVTINNNQYEMVLLSKIALRYNTNFIWQGRYNPDKCTELLPYRNRIHRLKKLNFTTKEGLIGCIENAHWHIMDDISDINVPRCHNLTVNEELVEFLRDYRTTYCLSLINFIILTDDISVLFDMNGQISLDIFKFACERITIEIRYRKRLELDVEFQDDKYDNEEWSKFFMLVNRLINGVDKFKLSLMYDKDFCLLQCKQIMKEAYEFWPTLACDGYNNLWILKPAAMCRGRGIIIKQNYNDIQYVLRHKESPYIIQKYIERPLIIYKTKFDIRQYMLVTITETMLHIWIYKDCYLRFSSQEYQLSDLNESVHLTNHAIQKKYKIGERTDKIPSHNMWSLNQFQEFLTETSNENKWNSNIYPGMKKNIIAIVLSSLEELDLKPNTFELYGCDFILDENFQPILLEINASPDLSHTTPITEKLCPIVLEDLIKVVVDLPKNSKSDTGKFELIYSITCEKPDKNNIQSMLKFHISGKRMKIHKSQQSNYNDLLRRRIRAAKQNKQIEQKGKLKLKKFKKPTINKNVKKKPSK